MSGSTAISHNRKAFTLLEAVIVLAIVTVMLVVLIPLLFKAIEKSKRTVCASNLRTLGTALDQYLTTFNTYPCGSRYQTDSDSPGTSWWLEIMPYIDHKDVLQNWKYSPDSGDFDGPQTNPNMPLVNGLRPSVMLCPSSPLPPLSDPLEHVSQANRDSLRLGNPEGIVLPSYVVVSGSVPDMTVRETNEDSSAPAGRNTIDGRYGVLSGSGVFPPNRRLREASIRDGKNYTMFVVEQSNWGRDTSVEPPIEYDIRSCWPKGAFMGTTGNYGQIGLKAKGINRTGAERCFNCTSIRYAVNTTAPMPGIVVELPPPEQDAVDGDGSATAPKPPPRPAVDALPGPGHNHGIVSPHPGGANVLMGGGAVRWLSDDTELRLLRLYATCDDQLVVDEN